MKLFKIPGTVIKGLGLGEKYGLPHTMNLRVSRISKSLRYGIYVVRVKIGRKEFGGVLHYGPRPAVRAPVSFEVHCFGLRRNCLKKRIEVEIIKRLRSIKNFPTIAGLKKAIQSDIRQAKKILE